MSVLQILQVHAAVRRLAIIALSILGMTMLASFAIWSLGNISQYVFSLTPRENIFDYRSVEYAGVDAGRPTFISTARFGRNVQHVEWVDVLKCQAGQEDQNAGRTDFAVPPNNWSVFSTYVSNTANVGPYELRSTPPWQYQAAFPSDGRACYLRTTVIAETRGSTFVQTLDSEVFRIVIP